MLFQRVLTVLILVPFLIASIVTSETWIFKLVCLAGLTAGLFEFLKIVDLKKRERSFALVLGVLHLSYLLFSPLQGSFSFFEIQFVLIALFIFACFSSAEGQAARIAFSFLGIVYLGLGANLAFLRDLPQGLFWIFSVLAMTWLNDTFAYFFGHRFGKRKLAPHISPGKTFEGFFGGYLGTLTGFFVLWFFFGRPIPVGHGLLLVFLVGTVGPLGDLSESLIKRSFGVKDSGTLIPGHGGMLDRIDALLFTAPTVYLYVNLFLK